MESMPSADGAGPGPGSSWTAEAAVAALARSLQRVQDQSAATRIMKKAQALLTHDGGDVGLRTCAQIVEVLGSVGAGGAGGGGAPLGALDEHLARRAAAQSRVWHEFIRGEPEDADPTDPAPGDLAPPDPAGDRARLLRRLADRPLSRHRSQGGDGAPLFSVVDLRAGAETPGAFEVGPQASDAGGGRGGRGARRGRSGLVRPLDSPSPPPRSTGASSPWWRWAPR